MKAYLSLSLVTASLLLLSACATTKETAYSETAVPKTLSSNQDGKYISRIEYIARQRGAQVIWVNPPRMRSEAVAATP